VADRGRLLLSCCGSGRWRETRCRCSVARCWVEPADLKPCVLRSLRSTGWCKLDCWHADLGRGSQRIHQGAAALPYDLSLSVTMAGGAKPCCFRVSQATAAALFRLARDSWHFAIAVDRPLMCIPYPAIESRGLDTNSQRVSPYPDDHLAAGSRPTDRRPTRILLQCVEFPGSRLVSIQYS
jgi:hypothetical protein